MKMSDAVMQYDINAFINTIKTENNYQSFFATITHIYFANQSQFINDQPEQLQYLCAALTNCVALISINLAECRLSEAEWQAILHALKNRSSLLVNIRASNIDTSDVREILPFADVIDDSTPTYQLPKEYGALKDPIYTEDELRDFLLIGFNIHMQSLTIADKNVRADDKISRKWLRLPYSIGFANHQPFIILKSTFTESIQDFVHNQKVRGYIKYALCFADGDINSLKIMFTKIRFAHPEGLRHSLNVEFSKHETSIFRHTQNALFGFRKHKSYALQDFVNGENLYKIIESYTLKNTYPDITLLMQQVSAIIIATQCLHAQGIIHRDIKPENILWLKASSVAVYVDYEGVLNCSPQEVVKPNVHNYTKGYRPSNQNYALNRLTDLYALGLTLRQFIVAKPFRREGICYIHASIKDPFYHALQSYYKHELQNYCHPDLAVAINKLLDDPSTKTPENSPLTYVITALERHYTKAHQFALNARYMHILDEILMVCNKYNKAKAWLDQNISTDDAFADNKYANRLRLALDGAVSTEITIADILYVQTLQHILHLFTCYGGAPTQAILEICTNELQKLHATDDININNIFPIYRRIHAEIDNFYMLRDEVISTLKHMRIVKPNIASSYNPQISDTEDEHGDCIKLYRQVVALFLDNNPIQDILRFAIDNLENMYEGCKYVGNKIIILQANDKLRAWLEKIGDTIHPNLSAPRNPILHHFRYEPIQNPQEKLCSAITTRNKNEITTYLQNGVNPLSGFGYEETALQIALANYNNQEDLNMLKFIVGHSRAKDIYSLATITKNRHDMAVSDSDLIAVRLLYKQMLRQLPIFLPWLQARICTFLENDDKDSIILIVEAGFDPLMPLKNDPEELYNLIKVRGCTSIFTQCLHDTPYKHFDRCNLSLMTFFMHQRNFNFARDLLTAATEAETMLNPEQLGFHLVVAAKEAEVALTQDLVVAGADQTIEYPCGYYRGKNAVELAEMHRFSLFEPCAMRKGLRAQAKVLPE